MDDGTNGQCIMGLFDDSNISSRCVHDNVHRSFALSPLFIYCYLGYSLFVGSSQKVWSYGLGAFIFGDYFRSSKVKFDESYNSYSTHHTHFFSRTHCHWRRHRTSHRTQCTSACFLRWIAFLQLSYSRSCFAYSYWRCGSFCFNFAFSQSSICLDCSGRFGDCGSGF